MPVAVDKQGGQTQVRQKKQPSSALAFAGQNFQFLLNADTVLFFNTVNELNKDTTAMTPSCRDATRRFNGTGRA